MHVRPKAQRRLSPIMEKKVRVEKKTSTARQVAINALAPVLPLSSIEKLPHAVLGMIMSMTQLIDLQRLRQTSTRVKRDVLLATKATPWTRLDVDDADFDTWLRLDRLFTLKQTIHTDRIDTLSLTTAGTDALSFWQDGPQWFAAFPALHALEIDGNGEARDPEEDFELPAEFPWSRLVRVQIRDTPLALPLLFLDAWLQGKMPHLRSLRLASIPGVEAGNVFDHMRRLPDLSRWTQMQELGLSNDMMMSDWTFLSVCCPNLTRLVLLSEVEHGRSKNKHLWVTDEVFVLIGKSKWASSMRHFVWNTQQFRGVTSKSLLALAAWTQLCVLKLGSNELHNLHSDEVLVPAADAMVCLSAWTHLTELQLHAFCIETTDKVLDKVPQTIERLVWQVPDSNPDRKQPFPDRRIIKPSECKSTVTSAQVVSFLSAHPHLYFFETMFAVWLAEDAAHFSSSRLVDVLTTRNRDMRVMHMQFESWRVELEAKDAARLLRGMNKLWVISLCVHRLDPSVFDGVSMLGRWSFRLFLYARRMHDGDACLRKIDECFPTLSELHLTVDEPSGSGLTYRGVARFLRRQLARSPYFSFHYKHACQRTDGDEEDVAYLCNWIAQVPNFQATLGGLEGLARPCGA